MRIMYIVKIVIVMFTSPEVAKMSERPMIASGWLIMTPARYFGCANGLETG